MTTESADTHPFAQVRPPAAARPAAPVVHPPRGPQWQPLPPPRAGRGRRRRVAWLVAVDALAVAGAAPLALGPGLRPAALGALVPALLLLHLQAGLYRPGPAPSVIQDLPALLGRALVCWCTAAGLLAAVTPGQALPLTTLGCTVAAHSLLVCGGRSMVHRARRNLARRRPRATLVVGPDPVARQLAAALLAHPEYGMRPVGLVPPAPVVPGPAEVPTGGAARALPRLTSFQDITRSVIAHTVRDAVFTVPPYGDPHTAALLRRFVDQGSAIWLAGAAAGREGRPPEPGTDHLWGFACRPLDTTPPRLGGRRKRALDLALAGPALLAAAPLLLGCALAVRLADGPGVLFRQERIGRGGRPFTLLKFRTLRPDDDHDPATSWTVPDDDGRTSRVGRLLRRTALDELPQLWNVLRGDMSLVGPRPERPFFVERFSRQYPEYAARHRMPAGLTGLAQVHGLRGDTSIEDRARFDNLYIDSWSTGQDLRILLRTAGALLRRERG
ncbi:exopolysaccharide biosynthesis polyprenyl glycosylphosphotransferase [Streptomyces sp. NPDC048196]|uniref:exopolysaccharide biosynthesis polyprenyl glycosylphosphotransferase n=1 Tax=Streptomyces sp. NPDC048196 TaxID=3154712 RepID=UPI0033C049ED